MSKLRKAQGKDGYLSLMHWCPGCDEVHGIRVDGGGKANWSFDNNYDAPTFAPSVRVFVTEDDGSDTTLCHYFITAGKIIFCSDSPHKLKGQTVDLPDWPYARGTYGGIED